MLDKENTRAPASLAVLGQHQSSDGVVRAGDPWTGFGIHD